MPRQTFIGWVVSDRAAGTVTVEVTREMTHPLYKKRIKRAKRFLADDPKNKYRVGDLVEIEECRPLSKRKSHHVLRLVKKGKVSAEEHQVLEESSKLSLEDNDSTQNTP